MNWRRSKGEISVIGKEKNPLKISWHSILLIVWITLLSITLSACGVSSSELETVDYTPLPEADWQVSTPEEQGLDPMLLAELYYEAEEMETLYGLLVVKKGFLIGEQYFNGATMEQVSGRASATKSFTSALVGIALDQGCLESVDQKMIEFFPEFVDEIEDPRKEEITIEHLLQMRGGYPDEEFQGYFDDMFFHGNWKFLPHLVDFPLTSDPGAEFQYSNLTSHLLGVIVARACGQDLESFAQDYLFSPMDAELYGWQVDDDGYHWGFGEIYLTARNMAKFGQMYLDGGVYEGEQIISYQKSG
jgi:CubicO group peptidase (beta-lactamase class C family)